MHSCVGHRDAVQSRIELTISRCATTRVALLEDQTGDGGLPVCRVKASIHQSVDVEFVHAIGCSPDRRPRAISE
jgi:hypothetical protein